MMKTILVTSLALTVLLAGFASQLALAQPGWGEHRGGPMGAFAGPRAEFMFEALDLTPEQRDAVEAIQATYRPQLQALQDSGRATRQALAQTAPDAPDYATVVAEASQAAAEHASQLVLLTAEMRRELHAVLTPQQRQKALELRNTMREQREQRFQERRERRRPGPQQEDDA
jgi:protein CpxP